MEAIALNGWDGLGVLLYLLAVLLVGLGFGRRSMTDQDFAVAGRSLSVSRLGFATFAGWIGLAGLFGAVEFVHRLGLAGVWWFLAWLPGVLLMAFLLAARLRERMHLTVPELLGAGAGSAARMAAAIVVSWNYVAWAAAQVFALGMVFGLFTGLSPVLGAVLAMVIVVVYTLSGGLPAVVLTDLLQALVMIGVIMLAAPILALNAAGGWSEIFAATRDIPDFYTVFKGAGGHTLMVWFLSLVPAAFIDPGGLQKVFAARNPKTARRGLLLGAGLYLLFGGALVFLGIAGRALLPEIESAEAMPAILVRLLPNGLIGIALGVFLAAAMSTADTALLVVATTLQRNVYAPLRRGVGERERLLVSRVLVVGVGLLALGVALQGDSVVAIVLFGFSVYVPGLLLPVLAATFHWRVPDWATLATILGGALGAAVWTFLGEPWIPAVAAGLMSSGVPFVCGLFFVASDRQISQT